tara:strand:+ start:1749 stop:2033 length:285 start_codon:yes stop_codon:yes gene_type:complete
MSLDKKPNKKSLIEFPCKFQIKVVGLSNFNINDITSKIILKHSSHMKNKVLTKESFSSGKKYISITATIDAINQEQLDAIYKELHAHEATMWVL